MPGVIKLATELRAARNTVEAALRELERQGILVLQGHGKGRLIDLKAAGKSGRTRFAILLGTPHDRGTDYMIRLCHQLEEAGHTAIFVSESLAALGMDPKRIESVVKTIGADGWILVAPALEVSEWFVTMGTPAFALFGRRRGLALASCGPDKVSPYMAAAWALMNLGHQRIILMARARRRLPKPGATEQAFLNALSAGGIAPSLYNLPEWEETAEGFNARLEELFRVTPPTALILDGAPFFYATLRFCALRGLRVPGDVSLVCTDGDPGFGWCYPPVSHIRWDSKPLVQRIVKWANNVSDGKRDVKQTLTPAEFLPGGTIGHVIGR